MVGDRWRGLRPLLAGDREKLGEGKGAVLEFGMEDGVRGRPLTFFHLICSRENLETKQVSTIAPCNFIGAEKTEKCWCPKDRVRPQVLPLAVTRSLQDSARSFGEN